MLLESAEKPQVHSYAKILEMLEELGKENEEMCCNISARWSG